MNPYIAVGTAIIAGISLVLGTVWWFFSSACPKCGNKDVDDRDNVCICKHCKYIWDKKDGSEKV